MELTLPVNDSGLGVPVCGFRAAEGRLFLNAYAESDDLVRRPWHAGDHAGLHLDFAKMGRDPASVVAFANKYGNLRRVTPKEGTPLTFWYEAADNMAAFVSANRKLAAGAASELSDEERNSPVAGSAAITFHMSLMLHQGHLELWPLGLAGVLWLFAVQAMEQGTVFVQCSQCGRHVPLSPKMKQGGPYYCGDTCRVNAYRERKAVAVEMVEAGKSVEQVATTIGSAVSTVAGWIGTAKRKRGLSLQVDPEAAAPTKGAEQIERYSEAVEDLYDEKPKGKGRLSLKPDTILPEAPKAKGKRK